jgi:aminopeptidase C
MADSFLSQLSKMKSIHQSDNRRVLINSLRRVIRQQHKIARQINRKYQTHQALDQYKENLKQRIAQLSGRLV